ncbi:hypothetical protein J4225_04420 [Candidatus Pacearchaeota archaeon]|nr:hypothetical protein [Candidatus Pacearchaeota archaeon]
MKKGDIIGAGVIGGAISGIITSIFNHLTNIALESKSITLLIINILVGGSLVIGIAILINLILTRKKEK